MCMWPRSRLPLIRATFMSKAADGNGSSPITTKRRDRMLTPINLLRAAWPAFLMACVLELVVFALVDPDDIRWMGQSLALARTSVDSLAFFVFWGICFAGNARMMVLN